MRKFIFTMLILFPFVSNAQELCDCSDALNTNLKNKVTTTNYRDFKNWLYDYFQKDETSQSSLKSSDRNNWGGQFSAVVDGLPIGGGLSGGSSSATDKQKYFNVRQSALTNKYITEEQFDQVLEESLGINQLLAYKACLDACTSSSGVRYAVGGDVKDQFFIQTIYKSSPSGNSIKLSGPAVYTNLEPINTLVFKDGLEIKDGMSITQYFKRIDPTRNASFNINTIPGLTITPVVLEGGPSVNAQAIPLGTIVSSVLNYPTFLQANGLDDMNNSDMKTVLWVPCDGRNIPVSKYGSYSGGRVPDLRGVFLRGINDFQVPFAGVAAVSAQQANPEPTPAGVFQADALQKHAHKQIWGQNNGDPARPAQGNNLSGFRAQNMTQSTAENAEGKAETRPKNVTVYYYIKVN